MVKQKWFSNQSTFSLPHVYVTFESQFWVNQWTCSILNKSVKCLSPSWSACCLPALLVGILCLQKLAVNIPEHDSHSAYFGLPKCGR